jgi:hypothetical protein
VKEKVNNFYLNEPNFLIFEIKNNADFPARNLILDFEKDSDFDFFHNVPFKVPTIFPKQEIVVEIPIFPKVNKNLTYFLSYNKERENKTLALKIQNPRLDLPLIHYSVDYLQRLDGLVNTTIYLENPSSKNKTIKIIDKEVIVEPGFQNYDLVLEEIPETLVEYELFNNRYKVFPQTINISFQQLASVREVIANESLVIVNESLNDFTEDNKTLDEETMLDLEIVGREINFMKIGLLGIVVLIFLSLIGYFSIKFFVNKKPINKKISLQEKVSSKENVSSKEVPKLFSYNEYEKLSKRDSKKSE